MFQGYYIAYRQDKSLLTSVSWICKSRSVIRVVERKKDDREKRDVV